jgi:uncharacterized protein (DUF1810 family)
MINQLKNNNIVAKVFIEQRCLNVILESDTVPNQDDWGKLIAKLIDDLSLSCVERLQVSGKRVDDDVLVWIKTFELIQKSEVEIAFPQITASDKPWQQLKKIGEKALKEASQRLGPNFDELKNTISDNTQQVQNITLKAVEQTFQKVDELKNTIFDNTQQVQNLISKSTVEQTFQKVDELKNTIFDNTQQVQNITSKAVDQTFQKVDELKNTISDNTHQVQNVTSKAVDQTFQKVDEVKNTVSQNLTDKVTDASQQVQNFASKAVDKTFQNVAEAKNTIFENFNQASQKSKKTYSHKKSLSLMQLIFRLLLLFILSISIIVIDFDIIAKIIIICLIFILIFFLGKSQNF